MSGNNYLILSPELGHRWGVTSAQTLKLKAGSRQALARLRFGDTHNAKKWQLSPALSRQLLINTTNMLISYNHETETVHIGPNVGIFSTFIPAPGSHDPTSIKAELMYLSRISRQLPGQFFVFTPGSFNREHNSLRGYVFHAGGEGGGYWKAGTYPVPDVVYDRITSRVGENKSNIRALKDYLMTVDGLQYFNPFYLNKWQVWEYLIQNHDLWPYLPETRLLDRNNLQVMLERHSCLYLKPAHGSLGLGIIRVERMSGGGMHYTVYRSGVHHGRAASAAEFLHRTQHSRKQMLYIVQQGINLARVGGSVFDLRVILQKDRNGEWRLTKRVARIAPPGSQISNLRRGGRAVSGERVMRRLFHNNKSVQKEKNDELLALCIMIADTIEQKSGKIFGELGLDIGIDNSRRWWLIEVNSKPRKTTETEASQRIMRQSFLRPLEYATWLAGF